MTDQWKQRERPPRLERRYIFANYDTLRDFLDRAADLSEQHDYYPDIGFGRDYVNITIYVPDDGEQITQTQWQFAKMLDQLMTLPTDTSTA